MAWLAVNKDGLECIYLYKPSRSYYNNWTDHNDEIRRGDSGIDMPKGSIKKLIGRDLTWEDEPVELKEELIMKCPKCGKGSLHFHAFSFNPDCYVDCDNCSFLLESEVSWEGCKNEEEHDNKCVEHLIELLKEE